MWLYDASRLCFDPSDPRLPLPHHRPRCRLDRLGTLSGGRRARRSDGPSGVCRSMRHCAGLLNAEPRLGCELSVLVLGQVGCHDAQSRQGGRIADVYASRAEVADLRLTIP